MAYKAFYETLPWQKTQVLVTASQNALKNCDQDWYKEQLMEAACKAAVQVAEGHERYNESDLMKYLGYAKDNIVKYRALLAMATQLEVLDASDVQILDEKAIDASKVIYGLRKYLRNKHQATAAA